VKAIFQIALGIIAAIGGFIDIGDLVFNVQAGALFGYDLLWAVVVGVIAIMVYAEMCGRVATVSKRPVFDLIRERLGVGPGLVALVASQFVNLMTVAAEIGGIAIVLELLFDAPFSLFVLVAVGGMVVLIRLLPFGGIERLFGYGGLMLFVFVAAALHAHPDWGRVGEGFVPHTRHSLLYAYFVVGLVGAALMPYEVHFYSSGAIEERWTPRDLHVNRLNAIVGYGIGGILSVGLMMTAAQLFQPAGVDPASLGTVALAGNMSFGELGLLLTLGGMLFAIGGAAIDACFSGAYNFAQFFGWEWGKYRGARQAPRFTLAWVLFLLLGAAVVLTGVDPVEITEYSVVFSVVALPLTYLPLLLIARDRDYMGDHVNGVFANTIGWAYFVVILVLAVVAIPLLLATNGGGG
jgi:Mn2+/Fe2+ NRAMP family transporter